MRKKIRQMAMRSGPMFFLLLAVTVVNAFAFLGFSNSESWKEEVLLYDGKKIIVQRWQIHGGRGELGQSPIKEHTLTFSLPGSKKSITWKDEYSKEIGHSNFDLLALHIKNDTPYIVASTYGCLAYNKWGRPNPPYVIFRYDGNEWQRIPLTELPVEFKTINLLHSASSYEISSLEGGLASVEKVKELNRLLRQPEYKTIVRVQLETGKNSASDVDCSVEIYNGRGGWRSVDYFTRKKTYMECLEVCESEKFSAEYCPCDKLLKIIPKWR